MRKYANRITLTIGLLCSKTFSYEGQREVLAAHGVRIEDVVKVNIKGRFMVWTSDGGPISMGTRSSRCLVRTR